MRGSGCEARRPGSQRRLLPGRVCGTRGARPPLSLSALPSPDQCDVIDPGGTLGGSGHQEEPRSPAGGQPAPPGGKAGCAGLPPPRSAARGPPHLTPARGGCAPGFSEAARRKLLGTGASCCGPWPCPHLLLIRRPPSVRRKEGRAGGKAAPNRSQNRPPSLLTRSGHQSKRKWIPQRPQAPVILSVFTMLVYVPRSHDTRPGYKAQTRPTKVLVRVTCSGRTRQKHPARCRMSHESHEDRKADGNGAGVKSRRSGPRGHTRGRGEGQGPGPRRRPRGGAGGGSQGSGRGRGRVPRHARAAARRCVWLVKGSKCERSSVRKKRFRPACRLVAMRQHAAQ